LFGPQVNAVSKDFPHPGLDLADMRWEDLDVSRSAGPLQQPATNNNLGTISLNPAGGVNADAGRPVEGLR
jgi:hypothetical protein